MRVKSIFVIILLLISCHVFSQENGFLLCADGIDNDGDGLIDCEDQECINLPNEGCAICKEGSSFADTLIEFVAGCQFVDPDPNGALGVSDWGGSTNNNPEFVSLGQGGHIKLGFTNNLLTNSGTNEVDLWVFEIGPAVEKSDIALQPANPFTEAQVQIFISDVNGDGYYEFGTIEGSTSGIDIDAVMPGFLPGELQFNAVEVKDVLDDPCLSDTSGADIDAVCALSNITLDCSGVLNGAAVLDACGECLEPNDPSFNQSCADCAGVPNGASLVDACGECLLLNDSTFNQSCADCAGIPNGTNQLDSCDVCLPFNDPMINESCRDCRGVIFGAAVLDECGECLEPNDPTFNQSCSDCMGIPNGIAVLDECGVCLEPNDSTFNQACTDCAGILFGSSIIDECGECLLISDPAFNRTCIEEIFIPNSFSPNRDGINDRFEIYKPLLTVAAIRTYKIYSRWGELVYEQNDFEFNEGTKWWDGEFRNKKSPVGIYVYLIEIQFANKNIATYSGSLNLMK